MRRSVAVAAFLAVTGVCACGGASGDDAGSALDIKYVKPDPGWADPGKDAVDADPAAEAGPDPMSDPAPPPDPAADPEPWEPPDPGPPDPGPDPAPDGALPPCSPRAMLVYVVAKDNSFSRFRPDLLAFEQVGWLKCGAGFSSPFSMSIDRDATAWVLYQNGALYEVSTEDASCKPTSFQKNQSGFDLFGMGFASDAPMSEVETLWVSSYAEPLLGGASQLGRIGFPGLGLTPVATFQSGIGSAELTGTGLGDLWGFFPSASPPLVARIDKQTGALAEHFELPAGIVSGVQAWAFAFWGGSFYVFFKTIADANSKVYRLDPATGNFVLVVPDAGHVITGAGVSSCAPTSSP
ncbi:MAG: hypothetical protein FJ087_03635 [Deltaproteobacteria bacterium]|nr:hypothetical protein [Deltaproteobacteria bacterium]